MSPAQVIDRLHSIGAKLAVEGGSLAVDAPKGTITPDILAALRENKAAIIDLLETWDEAEAYRLFKEALDATAKAYEIARPAWCHPLFDAIEKAWDAKDMDALRATTQQAVTLAREVIDRSPPKKGAEQPKEPAKRRYGTDRKDVPRCHGCGAEVQHWTVTRCQHCRNKDREDATRGPRMAQGGF